MERVPTGVPGFDELVGGGLPLGSTTLLTGQPGTGKSIFALQYIFNGIQKGENGIYVYSESSTESLEKQAIGFGFDMNKAVSEGKLALINVPLEDTKFDLLYTIEKKKEELGAKRVVFDSLTTFTVSLNLFTIPLGYAGSAAASITVDTTGHGKSIGKPDWKDAEGFISKHLVNYKSNPEKRLIYIIIETLNKMGTTNLVITFSGQKENKLTLDGMSEYICDGIVAFYNDLIGAKHVRTMSVLKMRNTDHSQYIHDLQLTDKGIVIKPAEAIYK
jgi:KaiC/GvpD/RAD55 family RecA-like ATPase